MIKKVPKRYIYMILIFFFIFYFTIINFNNGKKMSDTFSQNLKNSNYSTSFIAHAGGGIDGKSYTNSLEAVEKSIKNGFKLIELDLLVTDDDKIIAAHDFYLLEGLCKKSLFVDKEKKVKKKIYFKDFKDCKKIFNNKYTLLKEEKIIDIFNNNKELILVTDKIQNFKILNQKFEFNDRLIVEVFTLKDYFKAKLFGIKNPMFLFTDGRRNIIYTILFNIKLISVSTNNSIKYKKFFSFLIQNNVSIFAFSSNNPEFNKKSIGNNITGVYTDFWDIDNFSCTEINKNPQVCIIY